MFTKRIHDKLIYSRRMNRLTELLIPMLGDSHEVLDVGCGDGMIDYLIMNNKKGVSIHGIDVLVRPDTFIEVKEYDGKQIPHRNAAFDTVMVIDVLHHTDDPAALVKEMVRCTSKYLVIKDHYRHGWFSYLKLRAMDYVGNAHYHVRLPYNYLSHEQWEKIFKENGLKQVSIVQELKLYTGLFHMLFDRNLHFIVKLEKVENYE